VRDEGKKSVGVDTQLISQVREPGSGGEKDIAFYTTATNYTIVSHPFLLNI
jgi:hypothetical protein